MPYKSEKIKIKNTRYDRRVKLTDEDKEEIKKLYATGDKEKYSQRKLAKKYGVHRTTIRWIVMPEKLEQNKLRRKERGGSKIYYDKDRWRETMKEHRKYKHKLYKEGKIEL